MKSYRKIINDKEVEIFFEEEKLDDVMKAGNKLFVSNCKVCGIRLYALQDGMEYCSLHDKGE